MSDTFAWNNKNSIERKGIDAFLSVAYGRAHDGSPIPIKPDEARATIGWLRGLLDRTPSSLMEVK